LNEAALVRIEPALAAASNRASDAPAWSGALAAAEAALAEAGRRTASVRFAVSDHYARYLTLAWDADLASPAEREAYLRHHFESVYGARAADWRFAFDRDADGPTRIAVAMDGALVAALGEAAARYRLAVAAIEPLSVAAFNRLRGALAGPNCFFVLREAGRLTALLIERQAPRRAASQRAAAGDPSALAGLLAAEAIDAGLAPDAPHEVCVAEWPADAAVPALVRSAALRDLLAPAAANRSAAVPA
jgi:hypothetical protein